MLGAEAFPSSEEKGQPLRHILCYFKDMNSARKMMVRSSIRIDHDGSSCIRAKCNYVFLMHTVMVISAEKTKFAKHFRRKFQGLFVYAINDLLV